MKQEKKLRYLVPVIAAAAALSFSGTATAEPTQSGQAPSYTTRQQMDNAEATQPGSENEHLSGTIRSIDTVAGTVTIKGLFLSKTFHAEANVLQGLKVGDRVDVTYSKQGDTFVASAITPLPESSGGNKPSKNP